VLKHIIAVVDDDESIRKSTTLLIASFGYQAEGFESAETLLTSSQLNEISCLIIDVRLPGINGLQIQSRLAAAGYKIPTIFITAYEDRASRRQAMQAGAIAFIGKPFTGDLLLETIRSALSAQPKTTENLVTIVDDDESIRRSTSLLIQSFGLHPAAFESAEYLLKSGQLQETACLIVDMQMPGMNGLELQRHLAGSGHNIPIIFITAYDNKEWREQAMHAGAVAFLNKPFNNDLLLEAIRTALRDGEGSAMS
jgi:FixJ family two-component response regulator